MEKWRKPTHLRPLRTAVSTKVREICVMSNRTFRLVGDPVEITQMANAKKKPKLKECSCKRSFEGVCQRCKFLKKPGKDKMMRSNKYRTK